MTRGGIGRGVRARAWVLPASLLAYATPAAPAWAWGASGHHWLSQVAAEALPEELPAFLRTAEVPQTVGELGREPDRSKGSGAEHDQERDPGHYVDLDDDGKVVGVLPLEPLPATREAFDTALRQGGATQYDAGYLPYAIIDGWQQLRKDFAYWRVDAAAARRAADEADAAWFARDRALREALIVRDLGYWSHFVGDASQPLHVSVHFNGWGNFPNPNGYTATKIHARFEGQFVRENVTPDDIRAAMRPYRDCACSIEQRTVAYLRSTLQEVVPLYEIEKAGGLQSGDPRGKEFVSRRLAAGASELRDMVVDAWRASATAEVSFPPIKVAEVLAGKALKVGDLSGLD